MHTSIVFYSRGPAEDLVLFVLGWKERDKEFALVFIPLFEAICR